jgi:hypothetical protein
MVRMLGRGPPRTLARSIAQGSSPSMPSPAAAALEPADAPPLRSLRAMPHDGPAASVIGVPLGPVTAWPIGAPVVAPPAIPQRPTPTAGTSVTEGTGSIAGTSGGARRESLARGTPRGGPEYPTAAGIALPGESQASFPSVPTYQTRVPLPVPLHDDARFPRPGLQLPRGAPTVATTMVIRRLRRGWLVALITALIALVAVVVVVAATRNSPVAEPGEAEDSLAPTAPAADQEPRPPAKVPKVPLVK